MKMNFLEDLINKKVNNRGDFNKLKNKISYDKVTTHKHSLFYSKLKFILPALGIILIFAIILIIINQDTSIIPPIPSHTLDGKCSLSLDLKTGDELMKNYYEEGQKIELPIVERKGYYFVGWRDINSNKLYAHNNGEIESIVITNDTLLEADWMKLIYDFNGITYKIIVDDKSKYDPFDENYLYEDKTLKQSHQRLVEKEFNLKVSYIEWEDSINEIEIINQIKRSYIDKSYINNNVFAAVVPNKFVSHLAIYQYIIELENTNNNEGILSDLDINQKELNNILAGINSKVYGYSNSTIYGEQYIYYNKSKIKEIGLEDPLLMWMKGKWTQQNFDLWLQTAQSKLSKDEYVLDINYSDYVMGIAAASGINITYPPRNTVKLTSKEIINIYKQMRSYYKNGLWNEKKDKEDVSKAFIESKTLLHSGYLYYLNDERYFGNNIDFEIGVVPYPISDSNNIVMTEPFEITLVNDSDIVYENPIKVDGEELKTEDGKKIYGINVAKSTYKNRSLEGSTYDNDSCVVIFNFEYEDFSKKDILHVIKRLSEINSDEEENKKFINYLKNNNLSDLNIDVILSTQNKESIGVEILKNLDFNLTLKSSSSSITDLYTMSYLLVTTEDSIASVLRSLENAYQNLIK